VSYRMLRNCPAYPKRDYRQWLTTWYLYEIRGPTGRGRSAHPPVAGVPLSSEQKCTIAGLEAKLRVFRGDTQYFCQRNP